MALSGLPKVRARITNPSEAEVFVQDLAMVTPAVGQLEVALSGCHLVLVVAGVPQKLGMIRD